ncbi:MAG: hypothetical protein U0R64_07400 [Candidatus Nanopelagicales bacterium]
MGHERRRSRHPPGGAETAGQQGTAHRPCWAGTPWAVAFGDGLHATWNFADARGQDLDNGLVFIDGGGAARDLPTAAEAEAGRATIDAGSPWLDLLELGLPWASGCSTPWDRPRQSPSRTTAPAPAAAAGAGRPQPPVPASNVAQYGYSVDVNTSPPYLALVQSRIGHLAPAGDPRGWVNGGLEAALGRPGVRPARSGRRHVVNATPPA